MKFRNIATRVCDSGRTGKDMSELRAEHSEHGLARTVAQACDAFFAARGQTAAGDGLRSIIHQSATGRPKRRPRRDKADTIAAELERSWA